MSIETALTTGTSRMDYDVLVAGAGPVGLMLATELQLAGARVLVVERREELDTAVKAGAINTASAEAFERRGLLPALEAVLRRLFPDALKAAARGGRLPSGTSVGFRSQQTPSTRRIPACVTVARLAGICRSRRSRWSGSSVSARRSSASRSGAGSRCVDSTRMRLASPFTWKAEATCAWRGSSVATEAAVWSGAWRASSSPARTREITGRQAVVTVEGAERLGRGWQHTPTGVYVYGPRPGRVRTVEFDGPPADREAPVTAAEIEASLRRVSGVDVRVTEVISATRYTDNARQATNYRRGRVLLCGDAAHVHSPFSGQGLNLGLGDAVNLGWKLAATVQGWAPEGLLDTYTSERHPIGAWVLDWTRAQVAVMRGDAYSRALRGVVTDFLGTRDGATYYVKRISGLWQRYDLGDGHPLVGATMPNLRLDDGTRLADHTHEGRALLVDLAGDDELAALAKPYAGRLELVRGSSDGAGVSGLLVRPDGFVAWASADGASDPAGLEAALTRWLGDDTSRSS